MLTSVSQDRPQLLGIIAHPRRFQQVSPSVGTNQHAATTMQIHFHELVTVIGFHCGAYLPRKLIKHPQHPARPVAGAARSGGLAPSSHQVGSGTTIGGALGDLEGLLVHNDGHCPGHCQKRANQDPPDLSEADT